MLEFLIKLSCVVLFWLILFELQKIILSKKNTDNENTKNIKN